MVESLIQELVINDFMSSPKGQKLKQALETIQSVQEGLYAMATSEDGDKLNLLKMATVFQLFFIDTLASGKKREDMTDEDWKHIAEQVYQHAILEDQQRYSEFVFSRYADYIEISLKVYAGNIDKESAASIQEIADAIRHNAELMNQGEMSETDYIEDCLWLSLEAMIKLIASSLTMVIGPDLSKLAQAVSQLAFEYGRYMMYAKEQAILQKYIENQYVLDEKLEAEYKTFLADIEAQSERFRGYIDDAFSPDLHESLMQSAALARAAGVKEEDVLKSVEDVDAFFL